MTTNEGGGLGAKWTVEEDRRLVELWINVCTNPIIGAHHKKSGFWNKVAILFNRYAPEGATKRTGTHVGIGLHHWYPNGAVLLQRRTKSTLMELMRTQLCS